MVKNLVVVETRKYDEVRNNHKDYIKLHLTREDQRDNSNVIQDKLFQVCTDEMIKRYSKDKNLKLKFNHNW